MNYKSQRLISDEEWIGVAKALGFENYPEGSDSWIFQGRHYSVKDIPWKVTEYMRFERETLEEEITEERRLNNERLKNAHP